MKEEPLVHLNKKNYIAAHQNIIRDIFFKNRSHKTSLKVSKSPKSLELGLSPGNSRKINFQSFPGNFSISQEFSDTFQMFEYLRQKWVKWTFENPKIYFFLKMNAWNLVKWDFLVIFKNCDTFQIFEFLLQKWAKWTFENPKILFLLQ